MTTIVAHHPAAPLAEALARAARSLRAGLHAPARRLSSARPAPRRPGLHALPDHLLRDLGLLRGDLDRL